MNEIQLGNLMQQQNKLLEQQNRLLQQLIDKKKAAITSNGLLDGEQILVNDLFRDEIRNGFLVTAHRKRLWNILLNIFLEIDRICRKHNIRYFAYAGTLLGAVRHKGFIPWDDDMDVAMLRPDYEKFKQVVKQEIKDCYFADAWNDYKVETEEKVLPDKSFQQLVKKNQRAAHPTWWPFWPIIKIKDKRTAFILYGDRPHVNQGMYVDVFPLDPVPPFSDEQNKKVYETERLMLLAITNSLALRKKLKENPALMVGDMPLKDFFRLPHTKKAQVLEAYALKNFSSPDFVGQTRYNCITKTKDSYALKNFRETVYLPFEKIEIPAPIEYENNLTSQYGDWRKMVIYKSHTMTYSADVSYGKFFEQISAIPLLKK